MESSSSLPTHRHPLQEYESMSSSLTGTTKSIISSSSSIIHKNSNNEIMRSSFQSSPPGGGSVTSSMKRTKSELMTQDHTEEEEEEEEEERSVPRHLTLLDLLSLGVGGTVGSGMFVLCGLIARRDAGPATCISFLISGFAACLSGLCYAEMSCAFPAQEGSSYVYAKETMGEWWGIIAASCLTLEYGMSGAAVARSWGDKAARWLRLDIGLGDKGGHDLWDEFLGGAWGANTFAFVLSGAVVALLAGGVKESKSVTNVMTALKLALVLFMIVGGFFLVDTNNFTPFLPPELGFAGVARGATSSFFGYLGYDEVCCVAGEAINPTQDVPRAVLYTLTILSLLYVTAAFVLTGMQPWDQISPESGFPEAFRYNHWNWAAQIAAAGEVLTLPVVVLICLMAQPRLQYAVAKDGLLPKVFCEVDSTGNLKKGTIIAGFVMVLVATFVPFQYIDDLISAGILVAFNITDSAVILVRYKSLSRASSSLSLYAAEQIRNDDDGYEEDYYHHFPKKTYLTLERQLMLFHLLSFGMGMMLTHGTIGNNGGGGIKGQGFAYHAILTCFAAGILYIVSQIAKHNKSCSNHNPKGINGPEQQQQQQHTHEQQQQQQQQYFQTPFVPYLPCLGSFVNWYLIAQLEISGLLMLLLYLGVTTLFYFSYGVKHSKQQQQQQRKRRLLLLQQQDKHNQFCRNDAVFTDGYDSVGSSNDGEIDYYDNDDDREGNNALLRTISLPKTEYRATHMNT